MKNLKRGGLACFFVVVSICFSIYPPGFPPFQVHSLSFSIVSFHAIFHLWTNIPTFLNASTVPFSCVNFSSLLKDYWHCFLFLSPLIFFHFLALFHAYCFWCRDHFKLMLKKLDFLAKSFTFLRLLILIMRKWRGNSRSSCIHIILVPVVIQGRLMASMGMKDCSIWISIWVASWPKILRRLTSSSFLFLAIHCLQGYSFYWYWCDSWILHRSLQLLCMKSSKDLWGCDS